MSQPQALEIRNKIAFQIISKNVIRGMSEKSPDKVKVSLQELEKNLSTYTKSFDSQLLSSILMIIQDEFMVSSQPLLRKNGLMLIKTVMNVCKTSMENVISDYLDSILAAGTDQDSGVRLSAVETLMLLDEQPIKLLLKYLDKIFISLGLVSLFLT
ncbi:Protein VAC14 [Thelohanellus kitauei]|uniref:Protein VAC14 n=1 Tax=Thelohanellus kitauei TaxID=669202 RepID=A0A0C2MNC1_THEKT|nr:Protein VAC14 [Thelohanellus kitauei]